MITELIKTRMREEAMRIENDVHYSAKGHYQEANYWSRSHLLLGVPTAIISAVAGVSALAQFDNHTILAGFLAIIVAALSGITTFLHPDGKATTHQSAGSKYTTLRNKVRAFYDLDIYAVESEEELLKQLKSLAAQRDELNEASLPISNRAYKSARKTILEKQERKQKATQDSISEQLLREKTSSANQQMTQNL
jgi:hypothetical protein